MKRIAVTGVSLVLLLAACKKEVPPPLYEPIAVVRRDIVVSAEAAGSIEPILIVDVKSRASGTILQMRAETGDMVRLGDTLVLVDKRDPTNTLNQAQADLEVARAQLANAESQKRRTDQMFQQQLVSEQEHEQANLTYANARAQLVRAETAVQTARDAMDDTNVRAPISGVIIAKNVEVGNVIASATRDVTGGVVLLRMADLNEVQVRTLVDETDIGKIQPGVQARITVDAYPNRPFTGTVLKIEPQSTTNQNVTMFPVLIRIPNEQGLLRPGMNAEVEIQVAQRQGVLAIPNAALRTQRDVNSAAQVLGLNAQQVQQQLAHADSQTARRPDGQTAGRGGQAGQENAGSMGGRTPGQAGGQTARRQDGQGAMPGPGAPNQVMAQQPAVPQQPQQVAGGQNMPGMQGMGGMPGGQRPDMTRFLPPGVTTAQYDSIRAKRMAREPLTPAESTISAQTRENCVKAGVCQQGGFGQNGGGNPQFGQQGNAQFGQQPGAAAQGGDQNAGPQLPAGMSMEQMRPIFAKMQAGQTLTAQEQALMTRFRQSMMSQGGGQNRRRFGSGNSFQFGGSYIVFVLKNGQPTPVRVRTGVTDMDYSEVVSGLSEQDTVLLLPSASLVQSQQDMRDRFQRMAGGGVPGMKQQTPTSSTPAATGGAGGGPPRN